MKWLVAIFAEKAIAALLKWVERIIVDGLEQKRKKDRLEGDLRKTKEVIKEIRNVKSKKDTVNLLNRLP